MKLRKLVSMREALASPAYVADLIGGPSWAAWRVLLIAIVGEELTDDERVIFEGLTGRASEPLEPVEEFWGVIRPSWRQNACYGHLSGLPRGLRRPSR